MSAGAPQEKETKGMDKNIFIERATISGSKFQQEKWRWKSNEHQLKKVLERSSSVTLEISLSGIRKLQKSSEHKKLNTCFTASLAICHL